MARYELRHADAQGPELGFRSLKGVQYRVNCPGCNACRAVRIYWPQLLLSRSQKRAMQRFAGLCEALPDSWADSQDWDLWRRYNSARKERGLDASTEEDVRPLLEPANMQEWLLRFFQDGRLVALACLEVVSGGLDARALFYDPEYARGGLGTAVILRCARRAWEASRGCLYLGYSVRDFPNMEYKSRFKVREIFSDERWQRAEEPAQTPQST